MRGKIKEKIEEINKLYDWYLDKMDNAENQREEVYYNERLKELRIQIRTLESVLEMI